MQANTWIVPLAGSAVLVVDPAACEYAHDAGRITAWLSEHGRVPVGIFLTHGHFDHIAGTAVLKRAFPSCRIAVHGADSRMAGAEAAEVQGATLEWMGIPSARRMLRSLPDADVLLSGGETLDSVFPAAEEPSLAADAEEIAAALSRWRVLHTPGHTPGSVCLYSGERNQLISGDTVFYRTYGRTDLEGGSESEMARSLSFLRKTLPQDAAVYPGHDEYGFSLSKTLPA